MGTSVRSASSVGVLIPYPASNSEKALESHNGSTIKLVLTKNLTTCKIGWLAVWCRKFEVDFGYLNFPQQHIKGEIMIYMYKSYLYSLEKSTH